AFRKLDELLHRDGRFLLEEAAANGSFAGVQGRINAGLPGHNDSFRYCLNWCWASDRSRYSSGEAAGSIVVANPERAEKAIPGVKRMCENWAVPEGTRIY